MADKARDDLHSIVKQAQADLSHDPDDNYHIARGLLAHGEFLRWEYEWDSWQAAIQMLSSAKDIFLQLKSPASRGESLYNLARAHARLMDYPKALLAAQEALLAAAESGDDQLTCLASRLTAAYLIRCQRYDEAAGLLDKTLSLSRAVGSPISIAQTLEMIGLNCAGQMNLSGARGAYAIAQEHYNKISVDLFRRAARICASNLRKLDDLSEMDEDWFSTLTTPYYWD
jgi:tetratricopeptide (TPR) repeat protein